MKRSMILLLACAVLISSIGSIQALTPVARGNIQELTKNIKNRTVTGGAILEGIKKLNIPAKEAKDFIIKELNTVATDALTADGYTIGREGVVQMVLSGNPPTKTVIKVVGEEKPVIVIEKTILISQPEKEKAQKDIRKVVEILQENKPQNPTDEKIADKTIEKLMEAFKQISEPTNKPTTIPAITTPITPEQKEKIKEQQELEQSLGSTGGSILGETDYTGPTTVIKQEPIKPKVVVTEEPKKVTTDKTPPVTTKKEELDATHGLTGGSVPGETGDIETATVLKTPQEKEKAKEEAINNINKLANLNPPLTKSSTAEEVQKVLLEQFMNKNLAKLQALASNPENYTSDPEGFYKKYFEVKHNQNILLTIIGSMPSAPIYIKDMFVPSLGTLEFIPFLKEEEKNLKKDLALIEEFTQGKPINIPGSYESYITNPYLKYFVDIINECDQSDISLTGKSLGGIAGNHPLNLRQAPNGIEARLASEIHKNIYTKFKEGNWKVWKIDADELTYVYNKYLNLNLKSLNKILEYTANNLNSEQIFKLVFDATKDVGRNTTTPLNFSRKSLTQMLDQIDDIKSQIGSKKIRLNQNTLALIESNLNKILGNALTLEDLRALAIDGNIKIMNNSFTAFTGDKFKNMFSFLDRYQRTTNTQLSFESTGMALAYYLYTFDNYLSDLYVALQNLIKEPTMGYTTWALNYVKGLWRTEDVASFTNPDTINQNYDTFADKIDEFIKKFNPYLKENVKTSYTEGTFNPAMFASLDTTFYKQYKIGDITLEVTRLHKKNYKDIISNEATGAVPLLRKLLKPKSS